MTGASGPTGAGGTTGASGMTGASGTTAATRRGLGDVEGDSPTVTVLCGGVGAARFLHALRLVVPDRCITAVVNTGDDTTLNGLSISPDLDTIVYTTAGAIDPDRGWGLVDETWRTMGALARYAAVRPDGSAAATTWFNLGDADMATHLYRTTRLAEGAPLTQVTAEIAEAWGLGFTLLPMSDQRVSTRITVELPDVDSGRTAVEEISFQEYFVRWRHSLPVRSIRFDTDIGDDLAVLTDRVRHSLSDADVVIIAPSNPLVSIGPIRSLAGVDEILRSRRQSVVAVSPIVGGAALKGPADSMLRDLGWDSTVVGVAEQYGAVAGHLVIDPVDAHHVAGVAATGMAPVVQPSIMSSPEISAELADACLRAALA